MGKIVLLGVTKAAEKILQMNPELRTIGIDCFTVLETEAVPKLFLGYPVVPLETLRITDKEAVIYILDPDFERIEKVLRKAGFSYVSSVYSRQYFSSLQNTGKENMIAAKELPKTDKKYEKAMSRFLKLACMPQVADSILLYLKKNNIRSFSLFVEADGTEWVKTVWAAAQAAQIEINHMISVKSFQVNTTFPFRRKLNIATPETLNELDKDELLIACVNSINPYFKLIGENTAARLILMGELIEYSYSYKTVIEPVQEYISGLDGVRLAFCTCPRVASVKNPSIREKISRTLRFPLPLICRVLR